MCPGVSRFCRSERAERVVSIVIPTYNEASIVGKSLQTVGRVAGQYEVLIADGASEDGTATLVRELIPSFPRPLRLLHSSRPRALQLNQAAVAARGEALLFVHADARLPADAVCAVEGALQNPEVIGGNFSLLFSGGLVSSRLFTWANAARRRLGIYYGDSGIFVRRRVFEALRGFRSMPLLEDYEFVRRMERFGRTVCLKSRIVVSDRRWRIQGAGLTVFAWVAIQGLYSLGIPADRLARWYPAVREANPSQIFSDRMPAREREKAQPLGLSYDSPVK